MKFANENAYDDLVNSEAATTGLDPALIKAVIGAESGFDPSAMHKDAAGNYSAGLMQVENTTFAGLGYVGPVGSPGSHSGYWEPSVNIHAGALLLSQLMAQLGNVPDVISAYNGGIRPSLGFGRVAAAPVTVCLQRNPDGSCAVTHNVVAGEYGNQAYVVRVLALYTYFQQQNGTMAPPTSGGGGLVPGASISFTPSMLTIAIVIGILWWILSPKGRAA